METFDPPPWMGGLLRRAADRFWDGSKLKRAADWAEAHPVAGLLQESAVRYQYRSLKVPIAHHAGSNLGQDLALAGGALKLIDCDELGVPSLACQLLENRWWLECTIVYFSFTIAPC